MTKTNNEIEKVPPSLRTLKRLIDEELAAAKKDNETHQVRCGGYLILAKRRCELDGIGFHEWLESNFPYDIKTAQKWIAASRKLLEIKRGTSRVSRHLFDKPVGVSELVEPNRDHSSEPYQQTIAEMRDIVSSAAHQRFIENLAKDKLEREKEDSLTKQLLVKIVEAGYRVLSIKLHPDKDSGSTAAMKRLNRAKQALLRAIREEVIEL